jgi:hypothetical protein
VSRKKPRRKLRFPETNKSGERAHQNVRNTAKAVIRGTLMAIDAYIKKIPNNLALELKELEK